MTKHTIIGSLLVIVAVILGIWWITASKAVTPIQDLNTAASTTIPAVEEIK